jgi:hypothetical protein
MESDQALSGCPPNDGLMVFHPNSIMRAKLFEMLANGVFSSLNEERRRQAQVPVVSFLDHLGSHDREAFREKMDRRNICLIFLIL